MKRIIEKIGRKALSVLVAAAMSGMCSCEKIFEYEGDCDPHWQIQFVFERNLQFTDAFAANVGSVRLDVFDAATGKLVLEQRESGEALATGHYVMPVTLDPGRYYFMAWCGMEGNRHFTVPDAADSTEREDLDCRLTALLTDSEGRSECHERLDAVFYGCNFGPDSTGVQITDEQGVHVVPIDLTKDTNEFDIILQHTAGVLNPEKFDITIVEPNARLGWDNSVPVQEDSVVYRPYAVFNGAVDDENPMRSVEPNFLVAQLSCSRLMDTHNPQLTITNKETGKVVFRLPIIKYIFLTDRHNNLRDAQNRLRKVTRQEYLDREDHWSMQFFLDENLSADGGWLATSIIINDWHVIENPNVSL